MIFDISKDELVKSLSIVMKGVSTHFTLPIYSCVLISAQDGAITLHTADSETFVKSTTPAFIEEEGQAVIPAKLFNDIVKSFPNEAVRVQTAGQSNQAIVSCSSSSFTINAFQPEDFPSFPEVQSSSQITIPSKSAEQMVKSVSYALSTDINRPIMTGILLEIANGTITMVATDSYRVAKIQKFLNDEADGISVVVPGSIFRDVVNSASLEDSLTIGYTENQIIFTFGTTSFVTRRIEGNFPNYQRVFPTEHTTSFRVPTAQLIDAIKRIRILVNASPLKNSSIKLSISPEEGMVVISANFVDLGAGVERIPATIEGEKLDISFNPGYILDGLSAVITDETVAEFTTNARPGVFRTAQNDENTDFRYLIMPVRSN